jgi:hypothetical protein
VIYPDEMKGRTHNKEKTMIDPKLNVFLSPVTEVTGDVI